MLKGWRLAGYLEADFEAYWPPVGNYDVSESERASYSPELVFDVTPHVSQVGSSLSVIAGDIEEVAYRPLEKQMDFERFVTPLASGVKYFDRSFDRYRAKGMRGVFAEQEERDLFRRLSFNPMVMTRVNAALSDLTQSRFSVAHYRAGDIVSFFRANYPSNLAEYEERVSSLTAFAIHYLTRCSTIDAYKEGIRKASQIAPVVVISDDIEDAQKYFAGDNVAFGFGLDVGGLEDVQIALAEFLMMTKASAVVGVKGSTYCHAAVRYGGMDFHDLMFVASADEMSDHLEALLGSKASESGAREAMRRMFREQDQRLRQKHRKV